MEATIVETLAAAADTLREAEVAETTATAVETLESVSVPLTEHSWYAWVILIATAAIPIVYVYLFAKRRKIETTPKVDLSVSFCRHHLTAGKGPQRCIQIGIQAEHVEGPTTQLKSFRWRGMKATHGWPDSRDELTKNYILRDGNWMEFELSFFVKPSTLEPDADNKIPGVLEIEGTRGLSKQLPCDAGPSKPGG